MTDFYVKLIDVYPPSDDYPEGYAFPVSEGILRARYRDGFQEAKLMRPDQVYRLEIPLEPSANLFQARHRIRLDISSSSFPNFDVNRNTGDPNDGAWRLAENTVHHDRQYATAIVLPVAER